MTSNLGNPQISIDVLDYCVEGDSFDQVDDGHVFTLEVKLHGFGGNNYIIRRSYNSVCEFDSKLRRTFPKSKILSLPLGFQGSGNIQDENFRGKLHSLTQYFGILLEMPEILRSAEISNFLDFEYVNGIVPSSNVGTSVLDIILANAVPANKTVMRTFEIPLEVKASDVIAWSFSTKSRDIGFSVTMDGVDLLAYQRYNSHIEAVMGTVEAPHDGIIMLIFDNTYSKIMAKSLTYSHAVLSAAEIQQTTSSIRQSMMYGKWRSILRRCLVQQAVDLTPRGSVLEADQLLHGLSLEEIRCDRLESEIDEVKNHNSKLQEELKESRKQLARAKADNDQQSSQLQAAQSEIASLSEELAIAQMKYQETVCLLDETKSAASSTTEALRQHCKKVMIQVQEQEAQIKALTEEAEKNTVEGIILRDNISRLKGEKKKLREFCIEMKGALEEAKTACEAGEEREKELQGRAESAEEIVRTTVEPLRRQLSAYLEGLSTLLKEYKDTQEGMLEEAGEDPVHPAEFPHESEAQLKSSSSSILLSRLEKYLEDGNSCLVSARGILESLPPPQTAFTDSDTTKHTLPDADKMESTRQDTSSSSSFFSFASEEGPQSKRTSSFAFKKEQLKNKFAAAAALAAAKTTPLMKRRASDGATMMKKSSSEAKVLVISGLKMAANKLETSVDRAINFLDIEGLLDDDEASDEDITWHNKKKPPGLGTYYI